MARVGDLFSYMLASLLISAVHAVLQSIFLTSCILKMMPLGWGGLVAPFVVFLESFILTLPLSMAALISWSKPCSLVFRSWQFYIFYLVPLFIVTTVFILITLPLDGGSSIFSLQFSQ
ncbi:MAG: hypothetical protein ABFS19_01260 [Thermodesulfobacteriota bacterium]